MRYINLSFKIAVQAFLVAILAIGVIAQFGGNSGFGGKAGISGVSALVGNSDCVNVLSTGALGNNSNDDTAGFAAAIAKADNSQTGPLCVSVPSTGSFYLIKTSTGLALPRYVRIVCDPGTVIKFPNASGTLFQYGTATGVDTTYLPGGIENCGLLGNNGGSDTSRGLQLCSNSTGQRCDNGVFRNVDICCFGEDIVFSGTSGTTTPYMDVFEDVRTHGAITDGLLSEASGIGEPSTFNDSVFFQNGIGSATGCAIRVAASSTIILNITNGHIDNNSPTSGQICTPATGSIELHMTRDHVEKSNGAASTDLSLLGTVANSAISQVFLNDVDFVENQAAATTILPSITIVNGSLRIDNGTWTYAAGASQTPLINAGNSVTGQSLFVTLSNSKATCSNTSANCQFISFTGTTANDTYNIVGTTLLTFTSATNIGSFGSASGISDLTLNGGGTSPSGSSTATGTLAANGMTCFIACQVAEVNLGSGHVLISGTAPTITTHFNTSGDSIVSNGTASITVTVGTGTGTSTGVIGLPTATAGWNCHLENQNRADQIQQTGSSTASATFTNFGTTFAATNWTNGDTLRGWCSAN